MTRARLAHRRLPTALAVIAIAAGTLAGVAHASGVYYVFACAAGANASSGSWVHSDNNNAQRYLDYDHCATGQGMGAISVSGYAALAGQSASLSFTTPGDLRIQEVRLWRTFADYGLGSGSGAQRGYAAMYADGNQVGEFFDGSADVAPITNQVVVSLAAQLPQTFTYQIGCASSQCTTGGHDPNSPSGSDERLTVHDVAVLVKDSVAPALTVQSAGLFAPGQIQHGTVPLMLTATDTSGIAYLELDAAGIAGPVATLNLGATPRCDFTQAAPCQNLSSYDWQIDTTAIPDGTRWMTVKAYDAAGNVTAQSPGQVTVSNEVPPEAATGPGASPSVNGTAVAGSRLDASPGSWFGTHLSYSYTWQACDAGGAGCAPIAGAAASSYTPTAADVGRTLRVVVTASNSAGAQSSGSAPTAPIGPGPPLPGTEFAALAPIGSTPGAPGAGNTRTARPVRRRAAAAQLRTTPGHVHNHERVVFAGRLLGGGVPAGGKNVEIQALVGSSWRDVVGARSDSRGRFRAAYRFTRTTIHITYLFRALVRAESGYPYATGASNTAAVTVN